MSRHSGRKPGDGNMAGAAGGHGTESRDERAQEYALRIMEALSGVDEELLDRCSSSETDTGSRKALSDVPEVRDGRESRRRKIRRPIWQTAGAWAAAICLVAIGAAGWKGYWMLKEDGSEGVSGGSMYQAESVYEHNGAGIPGGEPETGADGCVPENAPNGMGTAAEGAGAAPNSADAGAADEKLAQDKEQQEVGGKQQGGNQNGLKQSGGGFEAVGNGTGISDGTGSAEGSRQETADGKGAPGGGSGEGSDGYTSEEANAENECFRLNAKDYTEQEIRGLDVLGAYVPGTLPEGYRFTRAYSNQDLDRENLTVCWSRGMDSIILHLKLTDGTVKTVDVKKPETYDERLYEIPYGETVPGEYRQTFSNPVFALKDFSLESVKSRMLVYEDGGDTATPRGNFGVLYPDGVLASFNGRGTAEEIWDMFSSMGN